MAEAYYKKELRELMALPENKSKPSLSAHRTPLIRPRRMRRLRCSVSSVGERSGESVRGSRGKALMVWQHGTLICLECSGIHRSECSTEETRITADPRPRLRRTHLVSLQGRPGSIAHITAASFAP